jgi:hypothetical protein
VGGTDPHWCLTVDHAIVGYNNCCLVGTTAGMKADCTIVSSSYVKAHACPSCNAKAHAGEHTPHVPSSQQSYHCIETKCQNGLPNEQTHRYSRYHWIKKITTPQPYLKPSPMNACFLGVARSTTLITKYLLLSTTGSTACTFQQTSSLYSNALQPACMPLAQGRTCISKRQGTWECVLCGDNEVLQYEEDV